MAKNEKSVSKKRVDSFQQAAFNQASQVSSAQYDSLGRAAPIFRVLLAGVDFPVATLNDLLKKVGGENRVLKIADSSRLSKQLYCVKDILDEIPKLDRHFPFATREQLINCIVEIDEKETRKNRALQLAARVDNFHLKKVLKKQMGYVKRKKPKDKSPMPYLTPCWFDPPVVDLGEPLPFGMPPRAYPFCRRLFQLAYQASVDHYDIANEELTRGDTYYAQLQGLMTDFVENHEEGVLESMQAVLIEIERHAARVIYNAELAILSALTFRGQADYIFDRSQNSSDVEFRQLEYDCSIEDDCTYTTPCNFSTDTPEFTGNVVSDSNALKIDHIDGYVDEEGIWTGPLLEDPKQKIEDAESLLSNARNIVDQAVEYRTIEQATVCGVMKYENVDGDIVPPNRDLVTGTIYNASFSQEGAPYNLEDEKTFYINDEGFFSVTGFYGPSIRGDSVVLVEVVREATTETIMVENQEPYYPTPETVVIEEGGETTREIIVSDSEPQCIDPFMIN